MNRRFDVEASYGLEKKIAESLDKMKDNLQRSAKIKREIIKLRRMRRQVIELPASFDEAIEEGGDESED